MYDDLLYYFNIFKFKVSHEYLCKVLIFKNAQINCLKFKILYKKPAREHE